jgi:hypothetical protein
LEDHVDPTGTIYTSEAIGSISTAGTITEYSLANLAPRLRISGFVSGAGGSIWFTEQGYLPDNQTPDPTAHFIGQIDPSGNITNYTLPVDSNPYDSSTVGPDGTLWTVSGFSGNGVDLQSSVINTLPISALASSSADVLQIESGAGGNYLVATINSSSAIEDASVSWGNGTSSPATIARARVGAAGWYGCVTVFS